MQVLKYHCIFLQYLLSHKLIYQPFANLMLYFLYDGSFHLKSPLCPLNMGNSINYVHFQCDHLYLLLLFLFHFLKLCILYLCILFLHLEFHKPHLFLKSFLYPLLHKVMQNLLFLRYLFLFYRNIPLQCLQNLVILLLLFLLVCYFRFFQYVYVNLRILRTFFFLFSNYYFLLQVLLIHHIYCCIRYHYVL